MSDSGYVTWDDATPEEQANVVRIAEVTAYGLSHGLTVAEMNRMWELVRHMPWPTLPSTALIQLTWASDQVRGESGGE